MKIIIAGSRNFSDWEYFTYHFAQLPEWIIFNFVEIVSGGARGADALGERLATGCDVKLTKFVADWDKHGKSAGMKRNAQMAKYADGLIAFWDGKSSGTKHMIRSMKFYEEKFVFVIRTDLSSNNIMQYQ